MSADVNAARDREATVPARRLLHDAVAARVFPAAVAEVGTSHGTVWREAFGRLTFEPDAPVATSNVVFDLASLTKPIATTTVILHLAATRRLDLEEPIAACFSEWRGDDRQDVTVRDLLEHASGLPARLIDAPPTGRREFEHEIATSPLVHPPRTQATYSDLGFILLGFLAADRGGASLAAQFDALRLLYRSALQVGGTTPADVNSSVLTYRPSFDTAPGCAPTRALPDDRRRGTLLAGEVHDSYASALDGVAGHAGLFGNVQGVSEFARVVLRAAREWKGLFPPLTYPWVMKATRKSEVPGSSRGLGWDTMLPTSSCGAGMSFAAFGHVGFTGTSLWIDPVLDRYFVLLTNLAFNGSLTENRDRMQAVRRAFHDVAVTLDSNE